MLCVVGKSSFCSRAGTKGSRVAFSAVILHDRTNTVLTECTCSAVLVALGLLISETLERKDLTGLHEQFTYRKLDIVTSTR